MTELVLPTPSREPASVIIAGDGWSRPLPGVTAETASPSIAELIDVIGEAATVALCDTFGGMSREIGRPAQSIVDAIGDEAAAKLSDYWGRGRIYIPRRVMSWRARHALVRRLAGDGLTRQAIAARVQLSERQVYSILGKAVSTAIG